MNERHVEREDPAPGRLVDDHPSGELADDYYEHNIFML